jgi:hypothetical protein
MNKTTIPEGWKRAGIGAGLAVLLLLFYSEIWMFCNPGKGSFRTAQLAGQTELYPNRDVYLPPW